MRLSLISGVILPAVGVGIVLFCLLSFIFPYGDRFKDKVQKIKAPGVALEVSVLALFVLTGVCMAFVGVFLQVKDYDRQYEAADQRARAAQLALEQAQRLQIKPLVVLEGVVGSADMPKLSEIRAQYFSLAGNQPVPVTVDRGILSTQYRISLDNMTTQTVIRTLVLEDLGTGRKWGLDNIVPLEPAYVLKRLDP